jgi:hypothetical protein
MELISQTEDIPVIGIHVKTFPSGIKEAFESLMKSLGQGRDFYGVSWMDENDKIEYYAMARQKFASEAKQYNYSQLTIKKGEYKTEALHNWMDKTDCIKDVFNKLVGNNRPDKNHPCIEWYKSNDEMLCMVPL